MTSGFLLLCTLLAAAAAAVGWFAGERRAGRAGAAALAAEVDRRAALERELSAALASLAGAEAARRNEEQTLEAFRAATVVALGEQADRLAELAAARHEQVEQLARSQWAQQGAALTDRLEAYGRTLAELDAGRRQDATALQTVVAALAQSSAGVQQEAARLRSALADNRIRGAWGEASLRRVLEQAGMQRHADFVEQVTSGDGADRGRPDVVVRLPNGRTVVIDAKVPLERYLAAADTEDPAERAALLRQHGDALAGHVNALRSRTYDATVTGSVDFVVLYVPGDHFLAAAYEGRADLFEHAVGRRVVLAAPSTLLTLLWGVAQGWRDQVVTEQAEEIVATGRDLLDRFAIFEDHLARVGTQLRGAATAYNQAVGSYESRLLPGARRFGELGIHSTKAIGTAQAVDAEVRALRSAG